MMSEVDKLRGRCSDNEKRVVSNEMFKCLGIRANHSTVEALPQYFGNEKRLSTEKPFLAKTYKQPLEGQSKS